MSVDTLCRARRNRKTLCIVFYGHTRIRRIDSFYLTMWPLLHCSNSFAVTGILSLKFSINIDFNV
jgi:hypothetical protein